MRQGSKGWKRKDEVKVREGFHLARIPLKLTLYFKDHEGLGKSKSFSNWRMSQKTEVRFKVEKVKTARKKRKSYNHSVFIKFLLTPNPPWTCHCPLSNQNVKLFLLKNGDWIKRSLRNIINNFQTVVSEWKNY